MVKLNFLGFTISSGTIRPGPKVHAIENFPRPRYAHEVRRFLGLTRYFRRFVVGYAKLVAPLTYLTKKDVSNEWGETQQQSFVVLRKQLCCAPVLRMFDPKATITQVHKCELNSSIGHYAARTDGLEFAHGLCCEQKNHGGGIEIS